MCCHQTWRKAFGCPFSPHGPSAAPHYSGTLPPAAWLQPFLVKQRRWFCAAVLLRAWGYMSACAWWPPLAAVPSEAEDWWSGRGRGGAATTLGARHSKTGRSLRSLAKGSRNSLNLAYSNLSSGLPQESGGKECDGWGRGPRNGEIKGTRWVLCSAPPFALVRTACHQSRAWRKASSRPFQQGD